MHYGDPVIRRIVPLALGLLSTSDAQLTIVDTLSKYSHDNDIDVAINAIFAMGLVGAGTNNARLAQMLRQLASYYYKEPDCLFMVRIAQGLVHLGKGTLGLNPFHTDRFLMSPVAVAGLLSTLVAFTDTRAFILDKAHWLLFMLVPAMYPRFLITFDEDGERLPVSVRVGQAVDVVGQGASRVGRSELTMQPASRGRSPASRRIRRPCASAGPSVRSWARRSTSRACDPR